MIDRSTLDLRDPTIRTKSFDAILVKQPIGDIYVVSMDSKSIQDMSWFDVRRRIEEDRDVERYLGIQRPLNQKRVQELNKYVNYRDATFPSSIIVSVGSDYARYDEQTHKLTFSNARIGDSEPSILFADLLRVIDGQHRIARLEKLQKQPFDVIVSVFIGSDISDQSYIFATVNLEQTKVNRSLAIDLFELARTRSPYKTCHNVAIAFDTTEGGPFYKRIKRLGVATEGRSAQETLTQATFVDGIINYISTDPKQDRDLLLQDKPLPKASGKDVERLVFRELFIKGEDVKIGRIYENYFSAIKLRWPEAWDQIETGNMIARTNGYRAFASIFGRIYRSITAPGNLVPSETFLRVLRNSSLRSHDFNTDRFKPGTSGESELRRSLLNDLNLS